MGTCTRLLGHMAYPLEENTTGLAALQGEILSVRLALLLSGVYLFTFWLGDIQI